MLYLKIKIDIDTELELIEELLVPYMENKRDVEGNMFIPCLRYPVYNISMENHPEERLENIKRIPKLKSYNPDYVMKYLSFDSYLPYKTIEPVLRYCLAQTYLQYSKMIEYKVNEINNSGENFLQYINWSLEDFLEEYDIKCPEDVLTRLYDLANIIIDRITRYTDLNKNTVIDLEYDTNVVYLINKGHIKSYRYDEYIGMKGGE